MEVSLKTKKLPFFWDQRLNMYDQLTNSNLSEMLGCVVSCRMTLEKAQQGLTPAIQRRVYEIFCKYEEKIVYNLIKSCLV